MKPPLKMHRPTAVAAAVFILLSQLLSTSASLSSPNTFAYFLLQIHLIGNIVMALLLSAVLFRGKKDEIAGVVLLITVIPPALLALSRLSLLLPTGRPDLYTLASLFSSLALTAFRGASSWECLSRGQVSAGRCRILLRLLPVLCLCLELWAQILLFLYDGEAIGESLASSLVYLIPNWIGPFLMGISLSIPVIQEEQ